MHLPVLNNPLVKRLIDRHSHLETSYIIAFIFTRALTSSSNLNPNLYILKLFIKGRRINFLALCSYSFLCQTNKAILSILLSYSRETIDLMIIIYVREVIIWNWGFNRQWPDPSTEFCPYNFDLSVSGVRSPPPIKVIGNNFRSYPQMFLRWLHFLTRGDKTRIKKIKPVVW